MRVPPGESINEYLVGDWLGVCQPISSLSHLLAAAVAMIAAIPLLRRASGSRSRVLSIAVYVTTVIVALGISGSYHWVARDYPARLVMQRLDHCGIWLLIAGTFTAVHGVMFRGAWRSRVLLFTWTYAIVGVLLHTLAFEHVSGVIGLVLYLGLGWVGALSIFKVGRQVGFRAARFIWLAGVAYSAGAVLEAVGHPILISRWVGPHEIFHVAVIVGVALHWAFIRRMLIDYLPRETTDVGASAIAAAG